MWQRCSLSIVHRPLSIAETLMGRPDFQNLRVYRLSEMISDLLWQVILKWDSFARDTIGKQLVRAVDSIGANIAEGTGRGSFQDNRRFVKIARGSLYETIHFLRRAHCRNLVTDEQTNKIKPLLDELGPKLNAYLKSIGPGSAKTLRTVKTTHTMDNGQLTTDY
jgi:four helix bundle protein